jgi:site-specific DNA-methyltransferase (adenine-specific)
MNLKSLFQNEKTRIILGETITVLNKYIEDESIDLIFVDPPYNIGKKFANFQDKWDDEENYILWCYQWLDLCVNKLKKMGQFM